MPDLIKNTTVRPGSGKDHQRQPDPSLPWEAWRGFFREVESKYMDRNKTAV